MSTTKNNQRSFLKTAGILVLGLSAVFGATKGVEYALTPHECTIETENSIKVSDEFFWNCPDPS